MSRTHRPVPLSQDKPAPESSVPDRPRFTSRGFFKLAGVATSLALVAQVARPAERALAINIGDPDATINGNLYVPSGVVGIGTSSPVAGAALDVNGVISAGGAASITASPPLVSGNFGWKIGLCGNQYAIGTANYAVAVATSMWVSVFSPAIPPAHNGTALSPDTNAKVSLGANGSGIFAGNVGIGVTQPQARLHVAGGPIMGQGLIDAAFSVPTDPTHANFLTYDAAANSWSGIGAYTNGGMWARAQDFTFWTPCAAVTPSFSCQFTQDGAFRIGATRIADSNGCYYA